MTDIDDWVLQEACIQGKKWQGAGGAPISIAVNLSNELFWKPGLVKQIQETLAGTGIDPRLVELELTENILLEDTEKAMQRLQALAALGVKLCIDDFGTGFSSLGNLKYLPVGRLKIDRSFVKNIASDPTDAAIVTAIISLGHELKRQVLAEGVESQGQLDEVVRLGCDLVQGYLLGRPETAEKLTSLLRSPGLSAPGRSREKLRHLAESARVIAG
jgi:EAL domain-containing protein (putative c-di-GMP-specific phosphodiesterase class I)